MSSREERTVEQFVFGTEMEADLARRDREKIVSFESRMDYQDPQQVLGIYEEAIENKIFRTPVGYVYLYEIYQYLKEKEVENIPAIPLSYVLMRQKDPKKALTEEEKNQIQWKKRFIFSVLCNVMLFITVLAMYIITLNGQNINILNYERILDDKYASWEQDLTEREAILKEQELNLLHQE